ncbi:MAG: peptide-methionine (R)-S-oxide reductase MsrB [Pseudomonadota bacterium]
MKDKIVKTEEEWKAQLSPEAYRVARKHGTERPGSHEDFPGGAGTFRCVCCGEELFDKSTKFDSGTGWPSFFAPIDGQVETQEDSSWFMRRTEVHCARCDAHLGHVFPDGPEPTGLRYCMNGVAMEFHPETTDA